MKPAPAPSLFAPTPGLCRRDARATSRAAARAVEPRTGTARWRVWRFIADRGQYGATDEEAQVALRMNPSTQRPRRVELASAGLVRDSGRTRATASGQQAVVWVAGGGA